MDDIEKIRILAHDETIAVTAHAKKRFFERGIMLDDVEQAIQTGNVIEEYPDDYPLPSCLIVGKTANTKILHTVVSTDGEFLYIITAYWPDETKWTNDFTLRR